MIETKIQELIKELEKNRNNGEFENPFLAATYVHLKTARNFMIAYRLKLIPKHKRTKEERRLYMRNYMRGYKNG